MYKLDLPVDYKEAAAIERRRNMEEQRKSRIFNAKTRIIGIDQQAIEQQIKDRKHMETMEKRRDEAFGNFSYSSIATRAGMLYRIYVSWQNFIYSLAN